MSANPTLSIIIVNWNSAGLLRNCLRSVMKNAAGVDYEVIVVDNASHDGCEAMMVREFPDFTFIQSPDNLGFAGANNLGFSSAKAESILFLNPDTEIVGDALQTMLATLQTSEDVGVIGPRLVEPDGKVQTGCLGRFPTILNQTLDAERLRARFPRLRLWGMPRDNDVRGGAHQVDAVPGTCLLTTRTAFQRAGGFAECYFMYAEDVDLCYEMKKIGLRNYYVPSAVVTHYGGSSSGARPENHFAAVMTREAVWRFLQAKRGRIYAAGYRGAMFVGGCCRVGICAGLSLLAGKRQREALRHSRRKWAHIVRWAAGLELWTQHFQPGALRQPTHVPASH